MTYYPRLSTLVAQKNDISLRKVYHQSCQLVSVAILPAATIGVLFAQKIIFLWTGNPVVAERTSTIAAILLIGTALNALASIPYHAQLAHGWTRLALITNIISLPLIVILILLMNSWYGIIGVSGIWVIYNFLLVVITIPIMHKNILQGEFRSWFWNDTFIPLAICVFYFGVIFALDRAGTGIRDSTSCTYRFCNNHSSQCRVKCIFYTGNSCQINPKGTGQIQKWN